MTLVYGDFLWCNHRKVETQLNIQVLLNREIINISCMGYYCKKCGVYYISEDVYQLLTSKGTVLARVISSDRFIFYKWLVVLKDCGYTDDLDEYDRHVILTSMVNNKVVSKNMLSDILKMALDWGFVSKSAYKTDFPFVKGL